MNSIEQELANVNNLYENALNNITENYSTQFNEIIHAAITKLNARYLRHKFILSDYMGVMSIDLYSRTTLSRVMYWIADSNGGFTSECTSNRLQYSLLCDEIQELLNTIALHSTATARTYLSCTAHQQFDYVADSYVQEHVR